MGTQFMGSLNYCEKPPSGCDNYFYAFAPPLPTTNAHRWAEFLLPFETAAAPKKDEFAREAWVGGGEISLIPMSFQDETKARRILDRWRGASEAPIRADLQRVRNEASGSKNQRISLILKAIWNKPPGHHGWFRRTEPHSPPPVADGHRTVMRAPSTLAVAS